MAKTMHMGIAKQFLLQVDAEERAALFPDFKGTDRELREAISADPREVFCGCDCVKDERGACTGETQAE